MNDNLDKLKEVHDAFGVENYDKAIELLKPLVDNDVPEALGFMGTMYQLGLGQNRDLEKAIEYLLKATNLGDGNSAHNLGTIYLMGEPPIEMDEAKSKMYYRKAKELGAQYASDEFYD